MVRLKCILTLTALFMLTSLSAQAADRDTAMALLDGADALIQKKSFDKALKLCERALSMDKKCPAVHFKMGVCHENLKSVEAAVNSYQKASQLANLEKDLRLARKADEAINNLSPGLVLLQKKDLELQKKLLALAQDAKDSGHIDTAYETFQLVLARWPENKTAKLAALEVKADLDKRGDPVKSKIAEAMLSEVWYFLGVGKKADAKRMAQELSQKYARLAAGKEAFKLLADKFQAPKSDDTLALKKELIAVAKKRRAKARAATTAPKTSTPSTVSASPVSHHASAPLVDLEALEKTVSTETDSIAKSQLSSAFKAAFEKGMGYYRKSAPGMEDNQKNLGLALEQFVKCESLYLRFEKAGLKNPELEKQQQQASMLRYACMKMAILNQG